MILHRCLYGITDEIKNAEMTGINGIVITECQPFDLGSHFSFPIAYETKASGEARKEKNT